MCQSQGYQLMAICTHGYIFIYLFIYYHFFFYCFSEAYIAQIVRKEKSCLSVPDSRWKFYRNAKYERKRNLTASVVQVSILLVMQCVQSMK